MRARRVAVGVVVLASFAARAAADPAPDLTHYVHLQSGSHVTTDGGTVTQLPPGYFMDEPTHDKLDAEMKRLQDSETRLTAENASLVKATSGWQPGWYTLAITLASGVALGWYAKSKL